MTPPGPAPDDLRARVDTYFATVSRGAFEELAELLSPDIVFLAPDGRTLHGRRAVVDFYVESVSRLRVQVRVGRWWEDADECIFEVVARISGSTSEFVGAVDHLTFDTDGLVTRMAVYTRPPAAAGGQSSTSPEEPT